MWQAMHQGQRDGLDSFTAAWCKNQRFADGRSVFDVSGNCLMRILEGLCANGEQNWYTCTRKQFMFQVADVCIIMHCILTLINEVNDGEIDAATFQQRLSTPQSFTHWVHALHKGDHGDILSAGDSSVLNFRQVLQHGVVFHSMQRMKPGRADKNKAEQTADLHCFSMAEHWQTQWPIRVNIKADHSAEIYGDKGLKFTIIAPKLKTTDITAYALALSYLASSTIDAHSRGKVVKHIVGRMKTLIGHNNTIPPVLACLLNPSLTKDHSTRKNGSGPTTWAKLATTDEARMKQQKKKAKAKLCAATNKLTNTTGYHLMWRMFHADMRVELTVHGQNGFTVHNIPHPVVQLHQDKQYYTQIERVYQLKEQIYRLHRDELQELGIATTDDDDVCLRHMKCRSDLSALHERYKTMLVGASKAMTPTQHATFFDTERSVEITTGIHMHRCNNAVWQAQAFKYIALPLHGEQSVTDTRPCSMKDPDAWGFSWAPKCNRKRIKRTTGVTDTADSLRCQSCGGALVMPMCVGCHIQCLPCVWKAHIGLTHIDLFEAGARVELSKPQNVKSAREIWEDDSVIMPIANIVCKDSESHVKTVDSTQVELWQWVVVHDAQVNGRVLHYTHRGKPIERVMVWHANNIDGIVRTCSLFEDSDDIPVPVSSEEDLRRGREDVCSVIEVLHKKTSIDITTPTYHEFQQLHTELCSRSLQHILDDSRVACKPNSAAHMLVLWQMIRSKSKAEVVSVFERYSCGHEGSDVADDDDDASISDLFDTDTKCNVAQTRGFAELLAQ